MSLKTLPMELILMIAENTDSQADIFALTLTNKRFCSILLPRQMALNAKVHHASGLYWASQCSELRICNDPVKVAALRNSGKIDTPLCVAVENGFEYMALLLLDFGAYQLLPGHSCRCPLRIRAEEEA
ncbi:hypothetical protein BDW74DRAFT_181017 [Aspergillus multicolor]|uniref:uncharacterized protein n=1 Tax=Aspergillus multicolor TaxID=41759 RepID=UPI003CCDA112